MSKLDRREFLFASFPFFWRRRPYVILDQIRFQAIRAGKSANRYLLIHGNEETARAALTDPVTAGRKRPSARRSWAAPERRDPVRADPSRAPCG